MKSLLIYFAIFLCATAAYSRTLVTPSFVVVIIHNDPEGVVSSDNITYVGVSRKTGNTVKIKGRTLHRMDADGVTPNKFLGYEFENNKISYFVSDRGTLEVTAGEKVLLEETGEWLD